MPDNHRIIAVGQGDPEAGLAGCAQPRRVGTDEHTRFIGNHDTSDGPTQHAPHARTGGRGHRTGRLGSQVDLTPQLSARLERRQVPGDPRRRQLIALGSFQGREGVIPTEFQRGRARGHAAGIPHGGNELGHRTWQHLSGPDHIQLQRWRGGQRRRSGKAAGRRQSGRRRQRLGCRHRWHRHGG